MMVNFILFYLFIYLFIYFYFFFMLIAHYYIMDVPVAMYRDEQMGMRLWVWESVFVCAYILYMNEDVGEWKMLLMWLGD